MVEGPVLVADAAGAGLSVEEVFVDEAELARADVQEALGRLASADQRTSVFTLAHGLRGHVDTTTPNAMAAVVRRPRPAPRPTAMSTVGARPFAPLVLVLCDVADPGNVGTLFRVAEAVAARRVVLTGATADPWSPKVVRASAGAVFRVLVEVGGDSRDCLAQLGQQGYRRVGTRPDAARPYDELDLRGPVAVVLGSEAHGLRSHLDGELDHVVTVPMAGRIESLNVAVTGAVLCFEAVRQVRADSRRR